MPTAELIHWLERKLPEIESPVKLISRVQSWKWEAMRESGKIDWHEKKDVVVLKVCINELLVSSSQSIYFFYSTTLSTVELPLYTQFKLVKMIKIQKELSFDGTFQ